MQSVEQAMKLPLLTCARHLPSTLHTLSYLMFIKHYDIGSHILILRMRQ